MLSEGINEKDAELGLIALHYYTQYGGIEVAKLLIENGASVTKKDANSNMALFKDVFL